MTLIAALAIGDQRSTEIADAIMQLVRDGIELGVIVSEAGDGGRRIWRMPSECMERLEAALNVGAFERLPVAEIVCRILTTPNPSEGAHV